MIRFACLIYFAIFIAVTAGAQEKGNILQTVSFQHYIDSFNTNDAELYKGYIPNEQSWDFLSANIPLLDCPDKMIEQTYYFRWWTYRKHIKKTPEGFIISEFHPDVPWAGKYNAISCPAAFHFSEGRWLHEQKYLDAYAQYWFRGGVAVRSYSFWPAAALYQQYLVTGNFGPLKELLPDMVSNYQEWEKEKLDSTGLFWQIDDRDGMEVSICGSGYRSTINTYMFGEATAIAAIAALAGQKDISQIFTLKATGIKANLLKKLWDPKEEFFKVLPRGTNNTALCDARELHGYTPWYFNIPGNTYSGAWKYLMNAKHFYAPYGPTSADQSHPGFKVSYEGHECQWNGPSWPFATTITLTGMANLLNNYEQDQVSRNDYYRLLYNYAYSHQRRREDGKLVPWIDENLNPFTGDWISRTLLKNRPGFIERGKDYNHSTFCDLVISGLIGIRPVAGNQLVVQPLIPDNTWDYFCIDRVPYKGKMITVMYDKTGKQYKKGTGMMIWVDGKKVFNAKQLGKATVTIGP